MKSLLRRPRRSSRSCTSTWSIIFDRRRRSRRRLFFETLECRRLLTAELEPNDSIAMATAILSTNDILDGDIGDINDIDYFRVALTQGQGIRINTSNANASTFGHTLPPGLQLLDNGGNVLFESREGTHVSFVAPATDNYFIRVDSDHGFGDFVDDYGMSTTISDFSGDTETEPNNTTATADPLQSGVHFRGDITNASDVDVYEFTASSGDYFSFSYSSVPGDSPATLVRRDNGTVLFTETTGRGGLVALPDAGTYTVEVSSANQAGAFTGQYVGVASVLAPDVVDAESGDSLDAATSWSIDGTSYAFGELSSATDVDLFSFEVSTLDFHTFDLEYSSSDEITSQSRWLTMYDARGQVVMYTGEGTLNTRWLTRAITPGTYFVGVGSTSDAGLGPYSIRHRSSSSFSGQRDVPLFFMDFNGQESHRGYDWVSNYPLTTHIPLIEGLFDSRYDIYDVDVTLTAPPAGTEVVKGGFGDFGNIGAGGYGGGSFGTRRPSGDSLSNASTTWTSLSYSSTPTLIHELGHGMGLPHTRNVLNTMAYGNRTELFPVGTYFPQSGTDLRERVREVDNQRDYMDWTLQAGSQFVESTPNDTFATATSLTPYFLEMTTEFSTAGEIAVGDTPHHIVSGDFNEDGHLDVVTSSVTTDNINIRLGVGDGTFQNSGDTAAGDDRWYTKPLVVGDFNKDNNQDIAYTSYNDNNVTLLLGNGNGTFAGGGSYDSGNWPTAIQTEDVNKDTNPDLIIATAGNRVQVVLGNGNGTFQAPVAFNTGSFPTSLKLMDLNGDTNLDVVTANSGSNNVSVLLGTGSGTFNNAVEYETEVDPWDVAIGDYDGDSELDLAVASRDTDTISLLLGNGNGTFQAFNSFSTVNQPYSIATANVGGDASLDLITTSFSGEVGIHLGVGDGTFSRAVVYDAGSGAIGLITGDLNGDARTDIATVNYWGDSVTSILQNVDNANNNRVVAYGHVSDGSDEDFYSFEAAAGEKFYLDIDSAEFQQPLDATLQLLDSNQVLLDSSDDALDLESGLPSADPYLSFTAPSAGAFTINVKAARGTEGAYRLKVTPDSSLIADPPRVIAAFPDGQSTVETRRQLTFFFDQQLDPATLTSANIVVQGAANGVRPGTASFNPLDQTLVWYADAVLPIDSYTVTLKSGSGGIAGLKGAQLDGETTSAFDFPNVSGNGSAGGDFSMTFQVNATDNTAALPYFPTFDRDPYHHGRFQFWLTDELSTDSVADAQFIARGAGRDGVFGTTDDRILPLDVIYDKVHQASTPRVYAYTRGIPDPDQYRIEASVVDAAGHDVTISLEVDVAPAVPESALSQDAAATMSGLTGTYINSSLRNYSAHDDWRATQTVAGTRVDNQVNFEFSSQWGVRQDVGVTGGSDSNWDQFSTQWDGFITIPVDGTRIRTSSDDGSRMWIDIDNDTAFELGNEFIDNNWGDLQGTTPGPWSTTLNAGTYRIRIQYYDNTGGTAAMLQWITPDYAVNFDELGHGPAVIDTSLQPNTVYTGAPINSVDVYFNGAIDSSTLTTGNFKIRYSPDPDFYDGNDSYLVDANNAIAWDPVNHKATFQTTAAFADGSYLIELNGQEGGIANNAGAILDGEYLDSSITGNQQNYLWRDTASGDGVPGGDYRAAFTIHGSADLQITDAYLVDQNNNPLSTLVHGERVYLRAEWLTTDLTTSDKYRVRFWVDDVPLDSSELTGSPGQNLSHAWYRYGWYASPGQHTVRVTIDADDTVNEVNELNNELTFTFTTVAPTTLPNKFIWPMEGTPFVDSVITNYVDVDPTSGIGDPFGGSASYDGHTALDAGPGNFQRMDEGVELYAAAAGTVIDVHDGEFDRQTSWISPSPPANLVRIDHGNGWETIYLHLRRDSLQVDVGDTVAAGEFIGYVGSSGVSTGSHVHFGVRYQGRVVEPFYDPDAYWVAAPRYVMDAPTMFMSGVTNYSPTAHGQERPSDLTTFEQRSNQTAYVWARFAGLKSGDRLEYRWFEPTTSGPQLYETDSRIIGQDYSNSWWWFTSTLPSTPNLGTWNVEFWVDSTKVGEQSFEVAAQGVPEIRVEDSAQAILLDGRYTPLDFGDVAHNSAAPTKVLRVVNHGEADLNISDVTVPAGFSITEGLNAVIAPGAVDTFTVAMDTSTAGYVGGQLLIYSNDQDEKQYSISLEGIVNGASTSELTVGLSERSLNEGEMLYGNVERLGSTTGSLLVTLAADSTQLTVPANVTIPPGESRVRFLVTAVADAMSEIDAAVRITASASSYSAGGNDVWVIDDDAPGITVVETEGSTASTEGSAGDTFTVQLNSQPTSNARLTIDTGDGGVATVSPTSLTFTPSNWATPQEVTLNATNDVVVDGTQTTDVTVAVDADNSADAYDNVGDVVFTVSALDDDVADFSITQTNGSTTVNEDGTDDVFDVVLDAAPLTDVTLKITSEDLDEATVSPATLTFTPGNWDTAQQVTVTGVDDDLLDGDQPTDITVSVDDANSDNAFDGIADKTVVVTTEDNDLAGFIIDQPGGDTAVTESGTDDSIRLRLTSAPLDDVVLTIVSSDPAEASVGTASVTFTATNWNQFQTVAIEGEDDLIVDGVQTSQITVAVDDGNSHATYHSVADQSIDVTTADDDVAGISITETDGDSEVSETGTTDKINVVLTRGPETDVVVKVSSLDTEEVTAAPVTLTFTPANWNQAQMVTLTGVDDSINDGAQLTDVKFEIDDPNSNVAFRPLADTLVEVRTLDDEVNRPPVLAPIGDRSADEGALFTFTAGATDPDSANTLTFSLDAGAPSGAAIDSMSGAFQWTPSESDGPGVVSVTVRVVDNGVPALTDFETFDITVAEVNRAPVLGAIGDQSVNEAATLMFTATASDPDTPVNALTFSLDADPPAGATIHPTTGAFSWTPTEAQGPGTFPITVRVTDDGSPNLDDFETIQVTVAEVNRPPTLHAIANQQASEGVELVVDASASDPDLPANGLTYSLDAGAPQGATIDAATGRFRWTPSETQGPGTFPVTIRVTDNGTPVRDDIESFNVIVSEVNQAPVLASIGNQRVDEGDELSFTASASDGDAPANTLTYSLDPDAPAGATIDPNTGVFRWTPIESVGPNSFNVTVRVTDNGVPALEDFETIVIVVDEVNRAPVMGVIVDQQVSEGVELKLTATSTDADVPANGRTYSLDVGAPAGAAIDPDSGEFSWTPSEAQGPGSYEITVRVTDDGSPQLSDTEMFTVIVNETNLAPVLPSIGNKTIEEESELTFAAAASDGDLPANALTYSLDSGSPLGAAIHPQTGVFSWTPTESQGPGAYRITIRVTDNGSPAMEDFETIDISVSESNQPPELAAIGDKSVDEETELTFTASATDIDIPTNALTFSLDAGAPNGATIDSASGVFRWTPTDAQGPGVYDITVRVTDDGPGNLDDFETIQVTVIDINAAPRILNEIDDQQMLSFDQLNWTIPVPFEDPEGKVVSLDVTSANGQPLPDWLTFDEASLTFTGMPLAADEGDYQIRVTGSDPETPPATAFQDVLLRVLVNPTPWHNHAFPTDVDDNTVINSADLRIVFTWLSTLGTVLPTTGPTPPPWYVDVNADNALTITDVRLVFAWILSGGGQGEAEREAEAEGAPVERGDLISPSWNTGREVEMDVQSGRATEAPPIAEATPTPIAPASGGRTVAQPTVHWDDEWESLLELLARERPSDETSLNFHSPGE